MSSYWVSRSLQPSLDNFIAQITAHRMMLSCGINGSPELSIVRKCYPNWDWNRFYWLRWYCIDVIEVFSLGELASPFIWLGASKSLVAVQSTGTRLSRY